MGIDFAIDELYESGWNAGDERDCSRHADGRLIPSPSRVQNEFRERGFELAIQHVQLFDCHRAEWSEPEGMAAGAVVGRTEAEASIYALARMRRAERTVTA